jgi:hypothetical protein
MKSFSITLVVVITALALPQSAYGNPKPVSNTTADPPDERLIDGNQAQVLLTEPATITTKWNNFTGQTLNLRKNPQSISVIQDKECQKFNPLELINNPESFFKECQKQTNAQTRQNGEPIEYLKVPKLDSGISVTVTNF